MGYNKNAMRFRDTLNVLMKENKVFDFVREVLWEPFTTGNSAKGYMVVHFWSKGLVSDEILHKIQEAFIAKEHTAVFFAA